MITITSEYLIDIIERHIRERSVELIDANADHIAIMPAKISNESIADFLLSIPYYDTGLKNFILGHSDKSMMIVSQAWEIEFILRTKTWAATAIGHSQSLATSTQLQLNNEKLFN